MKSISRKKIEDEQTIFAKKINGQEKTGGLLPKA